MTDPSWAWPEQGHENDEAEPADAGVDHEAGALGGAAPAIHGISQPLGVARIAGFVTRADAGLRAPVSVSHNITPSAGGCAVHYGGPGTVGGRAADPSTHARCAATWRAWQAYHMDTHGWVDIAYTGAYCQHGYAFAGRGFGVRTAANGTDDANQRYLAFVWLGCSGDEQPSAQAISALEWWISEARRAGGAGSDVQPHGALFPTDCPGDALRAQAARLRGTPVVVVPPPHPAPKPVGPVVVERGVPAPAFPLPAGSVFGPEAAGAAYVSGYHGHALDLARWQARMSHRGWTISADGLYGSLGDSTPKGETANVAKAAQAAWGLSTDSLIGRATWAAAWTRDITRG